MKMFQYPEEEDKSARGLLESKWNCHVMVPEVVQSYISWFIWLTAA